MAEPANSPKVSPSDSIPLDIEPIASKNTPTEAAADGQDGKTNGDASAEHILEKESESLETGVSSEGAIAAAPETTVAEAAEDQPTAGVENRDPVDPINVNGDNVKAAESAVVDQNTSAAQTPASSTTYELEPVNLNEDIRPETQVAPSNDQPSQPPPPESPQAPPTPPAKGPVPPGAPLRRQSRPDSRASRPSSIDASSTFTRNGIASPSMSTTSLGANMSPTSSHMRSMTISKGNTVSTVLITTALDAIQASRDAKRSQPLRESVHRALELVRAGMGGDRPREIFEPLRLACETRNEKLIIASLDCISKLISYSFFVETNPSPQPISLPSPPPSPTLNGRTSTSSAHPPNLPEPSLIDLVVHTITQCHTETTADAISLQVVKALLALVLSSTILVHQSSLLKAVRTVYNVFLMSTDPVNQTVAQGGLTQMVHHIFGRCKTALDLVKEATESTASLVGKAEMEGAVFPKRRSTFRPATPDTGKAQSLSSRDEVSSVADESANGEEKATEEQSGEGPATTAAEGEAQPDGNVHSEPNGSLTVKTSEAGNMPLSASAIVEDDGLYASDGHDTGLNAAHRPLTTSELFLKDAFLIFRSMCKLTMKSLVTESEREMKSHGMRSKLLSLHMVLIILNSHMDIFVNPYSMVYSSSSRDPVPFIQMANQYLCLTLSRNAVSPVPQVFEVSVEIFWRVLSGLRTKLKKEIGVLFHEIFIPVLELKTSTLKQKSVILGMLSRLCQDPQALVEIFLNYDCDSKAIDNIYEHLMNILTKIAAASISTASQRTANDPTASPGLHPTKSQHNHNSNIAPSLSTSALSVPGSLDTTTLGQSEQQLRRQGLESLVAVLRSLVAWGTASGKSAADVAKEARASSASARGETFSEDRDRERRGSASGSMADGISPDQSQSQSMERLSMAAVAANGANGASNGAATDMSGTTRANTPDVYGAGALAEDDPSRFESAKQKKTTLLEGIKKFNFKPKRGISFLIETGFIPSKEPQDIARFLLNTDGLSKTMIGEYLGEGDDEHIATMHAFVDLIDLRNMPFVDALRAFLQAFRLPGEAQKIDRFLLKFAERYIEGNANSTFANADTAYILSFSVIMLNTDAHNPQVKNRMTKADFVKNNRGINDGQSLPEELLHAIYDDIVNNEIRMKDEVDASIAAGVTPTGTGIANALATVGRDLQREQYMLQSSGMINKTEALFKTMMRSQRRGARTEDQFYSASHFVHVRPMFEVAWIPFLAGISGPLQETDDMETVELCLDGFKSAIRIVCFFDLELERNAFVTTLAKFTFLNNLGEMKAKNMEAIKTLLDIAVTEGNNLKGSWHEVLSCVSQLEHMQLISSGVDIPDSRKGKPRKLPNEELANESRSTHITVAADMVFSLSGYLSGTAIIDFVQALCDISWEEIQSSGLSQHPRLFSLQKLVEISYYNMSRIRLEWSNIWDILGEHFNQCCCHSNPHVGFFALDSLRQLAMRFLEKEELTHFKFQKDFLKPFEYTMTHNQNPDIRELVLQCLQQMIQARVQNMRSGWRTMFGVFSAASKVLTERITSSAFEIVTRLNKEHFASIVRYGSFADLTVCITDFCKVSKYQKISLLAIAMLRGVIPVMLVTPECGLTEAGGPAEGVTDDPMIKYWFPVLFSFYDVIMNGEDLEVRRLALDSLFSTLKTYGAAFPVDFWDTVCQELLFPIFAVLKSSQDLSRFSTQEDMSVWLSTTMIQALRDLIDLYTYYFEILERFLDGLLDLLCVCICQENDTLARIGTSCLQQLLENNVKKLSAARWERVATTFVKLFKTTTPHQLFDESLRVEIDSGSPEPHDSTDSNGETILPAPLSPSLHDSQKMNVRSNLNDRRRIFKQIIVKCVLQLLLIETTNDLLRNSEVYSTIPPEHLLRLMGVLDHSYQFARMFNEDKELRTGLWRVGFMKHLPNLLKQESSSASTLVHVLLRMYYDPRPEHQAARPQVAERLLPLGLGVLQDYTKLRSDTQAKNIAAWTPVVGEILHGFCRFDDKAFMRYLSAIYPLAAELIARETSPQIREGLRDYFVRAGRLQGILDS